MTVAGVFALTTAAWVTAVALGAGQAAPAAARPALAEEVFTNIQVLKGCPADEFMGSMGFISNALAVNCTYCHLGEGGGGWAEYAKDNPKKQMARQMIVMVNTINKTNFGGRRVVTCVTCHNGANVPATIRKLDTVYGTPTTDEPLNITRQAPGSPTADQILDEYLQAIGGAERAARHSQAGSPRARILATATRSRCRSRFTPRRRINGRRSFARSAGSAPPPSMDGTDGSRRLTPKRRCRCVRSPGASSRVHASTPNFRSPRGVKQFLGSWQGSLPATLGDDRDVYVIQGATASGLPVKLYFDFESGLLVRQIRFVEALLGRNMIQVDYDDYRDVAGVKMPFKWTWAWQSGQGKIELSDVQPNVPVDAARFARPAAPTAAAAR